MTPPGPSSEQNPQTPSQKHELIIKGAAVAPIWLKIGVPCIFFREESEYDTPGAQFWAKTTKNANTFIRTHKNINKTNKK